MLLALLAAGAALLLLARPSLLFNSAVAGFALRLAPLDARWESLSASAERLDGARHRYALAARGFCFALPSGAAAGCLRDVSLGATASWTWRGPRLEAGGLLLRGESLRLASRGGGAGGPRLPALPAALAGARLERLDVDLPLLQWAAPGLTVTGRAALRREPSARLPWQAAADLRVRDASGARRLRVDAEAGFSAGGGEARASGAYDGRPFRAGGTARVRAGTWTLTLGARSGALSAGGRWTAAPGRGGWRLAGELAAAASAGRVSLRACRGTAPAALPGAARLDCRWDAAPAPLPGGRQLPPVGGPFSLAGRLAGWSKGSAFAGRAEAVLEPRPGVYVLNGRAALEAAGRLGGESRLRHDARARVRVPRFSELVALLREGPWAVPAPFHALEGELEAEASSRGDPRGGPRRAQWSARCALAGTRQRLEARASGLAAAAPGARPRVDAELVLADVALELPRVDVGVLPRPVLDRRIGRRAAAPPPPAADLSVRVRTEKPLRLFSNLATDPVPVTLDLALAPPAAASGTVTLGRFGVSLFRRSAQVERLDLGLSPGRAATLDGVVSYRAAEAVIRILLLGTSKKPRVEFESDPPMERDEIIALLVYGKSPSELDLDEEQSVGNTRIALESKAFGLASLYLFGTTPIETVTYDAASRSYAVKFRLPGRASMELSSDFSTTRELRVRKLLAPHWAIQSELQSRRDAAGQESGGGSAWLEWFDRY